MIVDTSPSGQVRQASARIGGHIDSLAAVAGANGIAATVAWVITGMLAVRAGHHDSSVGTLIAAAVAITLTNFGAVSAIGWRIRCHVHYTIDEDVSVVCRRQDRITAQLTRLIEQTNRSAVGVAPVTDSWQAYLAGKLDREE